MKSVGFLRFPIEKNSLATLALNGRNERKKIPTTNWLTESCVNCNLSLLSLLNKILCFHVGFNHYIFNWILFYYCEHSRCKNAQQFYVCESEKPINMSICWIHMFKMHTLQLQLLSPNIAHVMWNYSEKKTQTEEAEQLNSYGKCQF